MLVDDIPSELSRGYLSYLPQFNSNGSLSTRLYVIVNQRYKCIVFGHELTSFMLSSTKKYKMLYTENGVITTLEFIIDNIYVEFGGHTYFHQLVLYIKH